ncbi:MAG: SDR family oxidoreductase [Pseudomonadota bacterium]
MDLTGKVALITGASRGIGAAAGEEMAKAGAKTVLAARSLDDLSEVAERIRAAGGEAEAVACDVADAGSVADAVARAGSAYGGLDILVNNAGIVEPIAPLAETDPAAWGRLIDVNVKGVYLGVHAALPAMRTRGGGTIINISSGAATNTLDGWSAYCTSKAAVLMITRMVHKEYAGQGIRSVGLSPGTVATDMQRVIKASGINPVSQLDWEVHVPADWPGRALVWLAAGNGRSYDGGDISLRDEKVRKAVGLIA